MAVTKVFFKAHPKHLFLMSVPSCCRVLQKALHCQAPLPLRILQTLGAFYRKSTSSGIKYYNLIGHRKGSNFRQASCGHKLAPQGYGERVFTSPWFLKELLSHPSVDFGLGCDNFWKNFWRRVGENLTNSGGPYWLKTLPCCRACWNDSFGFLCKLPSHAFCAKRLMSTKPQLQWVGKHLVLRQERTWLTGCSKISTDLWRGAVNGLAAKNKSLSYKNAIQNSTGENLTNSGPYWLKTLPCCRAC